MLIVIMGVSGCGKSTVGDALARHLKVPFIEGDLLHPAGNIAKMKNGIPLDDADRAPWLRDVGIALGAYTKTGGAVAACSALKEVYRSILADAAGSPVQFVHLAGSRETLLQRLQTRTGHFMPASLLDSQLAALEPPAGVCIVDCTLPVDEILGRILGLCGVSLPSG